MQSGTQKLPIKKSEFAARCRNVQARMKQSGLDGLLVCSRGGGTVDRYGDVKYLTNYYSRFPFIPDVPGAWQARAHTFVILAVTGEPVLIADDPPADENEAVACDLTMTANVTESVIEAVRGAFRQDSRIGIAGSDTIPWRVHRQIADALPSIEWVDADHVLIQERLIKSPTEIEILRRASRLGSRVTDAMLACAVPGATHGDIVAAGMDVLVRGGGIMYNSFMSSGRGGNAPTMVSSSFPTWGSHEVLEDGDWFHVGISGALEGYYFDHARSAPVGNATAEQIRVFEAPMHAVNAAIAAIRPGVRASDVARVGREKLESLGFALEGSFKGFGHGIGLGWDSPWLIETDHTVLQENMVLCVERSVRHMGYVGDFEETVLVTSDGCELLTDARIFWW